MTATVTAMFGKLRPVQGRRNVPAGRLAVAGVLVAAVVGVAFGTGYTTTKVLATDDSAWLQKGDTIVQVNGPSGRYDAVVADKPTALAGSARDRLQIVEGPNSQVFAADPATHKVYRINLSTMAPQSLGAPGTSVLAAGGSHFVVNATSGTVTSFDPKTLNLTRPMKVPGGVASDAITASGVVYIGSNDGTVTVIDHGKVTTSQVGAKGHPIEVSVVGNRPIAIDATTGQLRDLGGNGAPQQVVTLPGQPKATIQVAPSLSGNIAWLVQGTQLVEVNPGTGYAVQATLPARDTVGAPLANAGNGYVADDSTDRVLVYDSTLHVTNRVSVPAGLPGNTDIQLTVEDGNVWADNPTSSEATIIHPNGTSQIVDKGTGNGVVVPGHHQQPQPPTTPATGLDQGSPESDQPSPAGITSAPPTDSQGDTGSPPSPSPPLSPERPFVAPTPAPVPPAPGPTAASAPVNLPVAAQAPITPPTTNPPPAATSVVPAGLEGKDITVACQAIAAANLVCGKKDLGQAPSGQAPNVVTAVPEEGQTVPQQSSVEVDYYSTAAPIKVPAFTKGENPQTYCNNIPTGLTCQPSDKGPGNPKGQVTQTEPAVGTPVPYGSTVLADYYSSSKPIFVPTPGAPLTGGGNVPTDPQAYCTFADTLGFDCTANPTAVEQDTNKVPGLADPGQTLNKIDSTDVTPAPSSTVGQAYGTSLTVIYFNKQGVAVPNEANQPKATACGDLNAKGLTCGTQTAASNPGQAPGTVIAGSEVAVVNGDDLPAANLVVASNTTVNFNYDPGKTVPSVLNLDQPTACAAITAAGLICSPVLVPAQWDSSAVVTSATPGAGTVVPTSSTVTIDVNSPAQPAIVGNCVGMAVGTCSTPGINYQSVDGGAFTVVNCNVILAQGTAPGTPVAPGSGVTLSYNSCYTGVAPVSEWHLTDNQLGKVHYLELGTGNPSQPGSWNGGQGSVANAYVPVNGSCPTGTAPLIGSTLPITNPPAGDPLGLFHYAFTLSNGFNSGGWSPSLGTIACVFAPSGGACPPNTVPIYSNTIDNVDWSWTPNTGTNAVQWCQLP